MRSSDRNRKEKKKCSNYGRLAKLHNIDMAILEFNFPCTGEYAKIRRWRSAIKWLQFLCRAWIDFNFIYTRWLAKMPTRPIRYLSAAASRRCIV